MKANTKDWIQYGSAITMIVSGVVLTFVCFFLNGYAIADSVLWYMAQALVYAGSVFGVGIYLRTKYGEVKNDLYHKVEEYLNNAVKTHEQGKEESK